MSAEKEEKGSSRHNRGDSVCNRLRVKRASGPEKDGKENSKKHVIPFPEHGEKQGSSGKSQRSKTVHKHILEAEWNDQQRKHMDSPGGKGYQRRLVGKDPDKVYRHNPGQYKHYGCKAEAEKQDIFFCLFHPVHSFCAVIVAEYGLCSAGNTQHGAGYEHHVALHNGGTGDEHITFAGTAVLLQHGIQDNDDHTVGCQNQEGGDTQYQDPFDDHGGPGRFPQPGYFDGNLFADQETESKGAGCKLCDDRGNGCTRHIHMQTEDKDRVQDYVGDSADQHSGHSHTGKPLTGDKIIKPDRHEGEERSCCVDGEIGVRVYKGGGTCPEPEQKIFFRQEKEQGQYSGEDHQHGKAVGQYGLGLFLPPGTQTHGHEDRAAQSDQGSEGSEKGDNRAADSHSRKCQISDLGYVSDEHSVNDAVKYGDELGDHGGDSQFEDQQPYLVPAQVSCLFHVFCFLSSQGRAALVL